MQKTFKRLAVILLAIVATVCVAFSLTACSETVTDYNVSIVYPDGKAVNGTTEGKIETLNDGLVTEAMTVQICVVSADGKSGQCFDSVKLGADGKAVLPAPNYTLKDGEKFKIQVNYVPEGYKYDVAGSRSYTSHDYVTEPGNYTIKLEAE